MTGECQSLLSLAIAVYVLALLVGFLLLVRAVDWFRNRRTEQVLDTHTSTIRAHDSRCLDSQTDTQRALDEVQAVLAQIKVCQNCDRRVDEE